MSADVFTPETRPNEPAQCAQCDTPITNETAMELRVADDIDELVCLSCYVNTEREP